MKLTGFTATYSPDLHNNTNKHNFFMNGIIKEVISENCCADMCETTNMRSLFAIADGSKSEGQGGDAAFLCMDMMSDVFGADFQNVYKRYFSDANRIVQSCSFNSHGAKMHMEMGVLYVYRDRLRAYNFGDVSIFHKTKNSLKKISGEMPKSIEVDRVVKKDEKLTVKKKKRDNIPYIGYISENFAVIPHISDQIKLIDDDCVIMVTESVMSVLGEKDILGVLNEQTIQLEEKATAIVRLAIEKNPEGNYTVQIVARKPHKPVNKLKLGVAALTLVVAVSVLSVYALPKIDYAFNIFLQHLIKRMYLIDEITDIEPWTTEESEEDVQEAQQQTEETTEEKKDELSDDKNKSTNVTKTPTQSSKPTSSSATAKPTKTPTKTNTATNINKTEAPAESKNVETAIQQEQPKATETPSAAETTETQVAPEKSSEPIILDMDATVEKNINDIINSW